MSLSNLRVFARNCVYMAQDLKDAFWPSQFVDALREADFAREALNEFEAEHDGLDGGELPDFPGPFPDPLASGVASATEAPPSVDASDRPEGTALPPVAVPSGHSNAADATHYLTIALWGKLIPAGDAQKIAEIAVGELVQAFDIKRK